MSHSAELLPLNTSMPAPTSNKTPSAHQAEQAPSAGESTASSASGESSHSFSHAMQAASQNKPTSNTKTPGKDQESEESLVGLPALDPHLSPQMNEWIFALLGNWMEAHPTNIEAMNTENEASPVATLTLSIADQQGQFEQLQLTNYGENDTLISHTQGTLSGMPTWESVSSVLEPMEGLDWLTPLERPQSNGDFLIDQYQMQTPMISSAPVSEIEIPVMRLGADDEGEHDPIEAPEGIHLNAHHHGVEGMEGIAKIDTQHQAIGVVKESITSAIGSAQWQEDFCEQILSFGQNQIQHAQLNLNPPELGPLQVHIEINQQEAKVHFVSSHAMVRDSIESANQRLREVFQGSGLSLANVNVSDGQRSQGDSQQGNPWRREGVEGIEETGMSSPTQRWLNTPRGLVDHYA